MAPQYRWIRHGSLERVYDNNTTEIHNNQPLKLNIKIPSWRETTFPWVS